MAFKGQELTMAANQAMGRWALQDPRPLHNLQLALDAEALYANQAIQEQASVTRIFNKLVWVPSLRACAQGITPGQMSFEDPSSASPEPLLVTDLREAFNKVDIHNILKDQKTTQAATRLLTDEIRGWLDLIYDEVYREVSMIGSHFTGKHGGRADLLAISKKRPDLMIEIDSDNKLNSVAKLQWAQQLGAEVLWVRWRRGLVKCPPGIPIIDLASKG